MFKPLLRTLPTLSGNFSLVCKLNDFIQASSKEYEVYVRDASLMPLQNNVFNKDIKVNLAKDQYEYVIKKFYNGYLNIFYKDNYPYNKNDYMEFDQYEVNHLNDSRNKDYELGLKRVYYSQNGYQFCFYAPFYIDDINDMPDYFYIVIKLNNTLEKKIKVMINKKHQSNYLKIMLDKYVKQIDNNVIFCLPDSKQATYFGIDVKNGGLVKYIDNVFGNLYNSQNTINNFDYTICSGFERHELIMKQIIPISFMFNLNDFLNYHELEFFRFSTINISGFYYKGDQKIDFYDFDIDYTELYAKYLKYDELSGKYLIDYGYDSNGNKINVMNVSAPSLNEAKYTKYRFTNKITPIYCRFKLLQSSDQNPYIINMSYGFSKLQNPNLRYGEFPTIFKDIFPISIVKNNNMILPINENKYKYYTDETNMNNYVTLMSNFYASWYNIFDERDNIFGNSKYWSDIDNGYAYYKGILYNLSEGNIGRNDIDKFGIFLNINMNYISNNSALNDIVVGKYILANKEYPNSVQICEFDKNMSVSKTSKFELSTKLNKGVYVEIDENMNPKMYYSLTFTIDSTSKTVTNINKNIPNNLNYIEYKVKPYSIDWNSNVYKLDSKLSSYLLYNEKMKKDPYGTFILDKEYYDKNIYYDFDVVKKLLKDILGPIIFDFSFEEEFDIMKIKGYELLDIYNTINLYEKISDDHYRVILDNEDISESYDSYQHPWYLTTQFATEKIKIDSLYDNLSSSINYYSDFRIFETRNFIGQSELFYFLENRRLEKCVWPVRLLFDDDLIHLLEDLINPEDGIESAFLQRIKREYERRSSNSMGNNYIEFDNAPVLPLVIKDIVKLQKYNYHPYNDENVKITNYFYKDTSNKDNNIYVDTYNLNKYIVLYNSINVDDQIEYIKSSAEDVASLNRFIKQLNALKKVGKINSIIYKNQNDHYEHKEFYSKIINRQHIEQYIKKLIKNENIFDDDSEIKHRRLLDVLYVKERAWVINDNKISIKDRYISLYKYLLNLYNSLDDIELDSSDYDNLIMLLALYKARNENNDYTYENKYLLKVISKNRNIDGLFTLSLSKDNLIELDLVFKKTFIKLNDDLLKVLKNDKCYLYLYSIAQSKENYQTWKVHKMNDENNSDYEIKEIDDFLNPIFSNVIMNDDDVELVKSMIDNNKIKDNQIMSNEDNFFKEINVDYYASTKCSLERINTELDKFNIYRIPNNATSSDIYNAILKLKEYLIENNNEKYYYEEFIQSLGVSLYSIYDINHVDFKRYENDNLDVEYDEKTNLNIVHTNNHNYGFYLLNITLDNTNNSFNINNSFDISTSFMTINGKDIDNEYVKSIFHIIQPFIKFNIFKDFASKIKNVILFPLEQEMNINYMSGKINKDDEYKYIMLKDSDDDTIYDSIVKYPNEKRLKLIRYFGFISPIMQKKSIIDNVWQNKYIYKNDNINVNKYNILYKDSINIYKYSPIYVSDGYDEIFNKDISNHFESQYEYKHFNDNLMYNLQETIIVSLPDIIEYDDLVNTYETEEYTLKIFTNYLNKILNTKLNINIILFLFNKYDINYTSVPYKLNSSKSKRLYKISYKFTLK
jgi:hypothetical protein